MNCIKQMIEDFGIKCNTMSILCDNTCAINAPNNLVMHSRSKHMNIQFHHIKELVEKCLSENRIYLY